MPYSKRLKLTSKSSWQSSSEDSSSANETMSVLLPLECQGREAGPLNLQDLPSEILETIFKYLPFEKIGKIRAVSRHFNQISSNLLNTEFQMVRLRMQNRFQSIRNQMPRRESSRRKHPLARESDIVETLHMRLTLLQMTFGKHIERKNCCFFAGGVLDEVYKILRYLKSGPTLNPIYKVTDELFDLSTMAMEYFKENIEATLPEITYIATDFFDYSPTFTSSFCLMEDPSSSACRSNSVSPTLPNNRKASVKTKGYSSPTQPITPTVKKRLKKLRESLKRNNGQVATMKRELKQTQRKLTNQAKQIQEMKVRYEDYDKKFQTASRKLNGVLQELSHCRTELQYWRSKSPAVHCPCGKVTQVTDLTYDFPLAARPLPKISSPATSSSEEEDEIDEKEFKPIAVKEFQSVREMAALVKPPLVVPACYSTPFVCSHVNEDEASLQVGQKAGGSDSSSVAEAVNSKPLTRACKRKLNMDTEFNGNL